ncbi:TMEM175 family protein [Caulobacter sp. 17J80-11]|uniref:TMEM175 family protein n=1 Tax=Caulobacter sp. 17J80-11 TaxID=2763502 RepID=UPI0016534310|nr:TMEM175 family protein [Caulobacter sp. 17J80-11]MBC6981021.1 DUF1211 domain-containing protein [Caulobacter sp. 17J80-11]
MERTYNRIAGSGVERLAALSDGLFAIAMTLIVLQIEVPDPGAIRSEAQLVRALVALAPPIVTYLMSFMTLGIFWVGQQTQLNQLARSDRNLTWLHLGFLAATATMPFSTGLLAEFITYRLALVIYWLNIALLGGMLYATWIYAVGAAVLKPDVSEEISLAVKRRIVVAQSLYAVGAALCLIHPGWSIAFLFLVQLNYVIAPRLPWIWKT